MSTYTPFIFLLMAVLDLFIAVLALKQNTKRGHSIGLMMIGASFCAIFYFLSLNTYNYLRVSLFNSLLFISIDWLLLALLHFVLDFTSLQEKLRFKKFIFSSTTIIAFLDSISLFSNVITKMVVTYTIMDANGIVFSHYEQLFMFKFHLLFCYILLGMDITLLIYKIIKAPLGYKNKYVSIVIILLFIIGLNGVFLYVAGTKVILDYSILFYSICGCFIYYNVFYFQKRNMQISTREMLMDNIGHGIIFFDYDDKFVDANKEMLARFPELKSTVYTDSLKLSKFTKRHQFPELADNDKSFEWRFLYKGIERVLTCEYKCLRSGNNKIIGKMISMTDITYAKDTITGLDLTPAFYHHISEQDFSRSYPLQVFTININGLSIINNALGHENGNVVMASLVEMLKNTFRPGTYMSKFEDGTIVALLTNCDYNMALAYSKEIRALAASLSHLSFDFNFEFGIATVDGIKSNIFDAVNEAIESMKNKKLLSEDAQGSSLIHSLTQTLLESDYETEAHVVRTRNSSAKLGQAMGLSDIDMGKLGLLSILHDIGKVGIPDSILLKPGKLNDEEWIIMKSHTEKGYRIAKSSPELEQIAELILYHHERWDGNGYPAKLKGEEIPLLSRIITVVDSFDVMVNDRPYHKAMPVSAAIEELKRCSGTQFDPNIVDIFLKILDEEQ